MSGPQLIKLPKAEASASVIEPYGVVVLWSVNCTRGVVEAMRRLNPSVSFDCDLDRFLVKGRRKAVTLRLPPLVWINFFGRPSAGVIAHEASHALGFALEERGALEEHKIGEEFLAYSIEKLVDQIDSNISEWTPR